MPDDMDQAQVINEQHQEIALDEHRRRSVGAGLVPARLTCIDCEEPIPEARRKAAPGCERCISCQSDLELHEHWRAL